MAKPDTTRCYPTADAADAFQLTVRNIKGAAIWLKSLTDVADARVVDANEDLEQSARVEIDRTNGDSLEAKVDDWVLHHTDGSISTSRGTDFTDQYTVA